MRLKLSRQIPRRDTGRPTGQVNKCGPADLALHDLLAILHREPERHQVSIIPNSLTSRQRHEPASFPGSIGADRVDPPAVLCRFPTVTDSGSARNRSATVRNKKNPANRGLLSETYAFTVRDERRRVF